MRGVRAFASKAVKASTNAAGAIPGPNGLYKVTLFPGDGIGPEIAVSVKAIFAVSPLLAALLFDTEGLTANMHHFYV